VGFTLAQPDFDITERTDEFPLYAEKIKVFLPSFFRVAGKHAEDTDEKQYHCQRIQYRPLSKYSGNTDNQCENRQEAG